VWGGEATEEHRKVGRILSTSSETERKGLKQDQKSRDTSNIVKLEFDSSGGFNQDTRKPRVAEGRVTERICWALHRRELVMLE